MDLATLDSVKAANEGAAMEVLHPTSNVPLKDDQDNPITITLIGQDSDKVKKRQRLEMNKRLKAGRRSTMTAEELEEQGLELLAFCTVSWNGIKLDGQLLDCTADNAMKVYKRVPWLREQVDSFVGDRANFLKD